MMIPLCGSRETKRETRRQAILAAAYDLFLEKGYEATTLSDIVARSGGSLATLYELFENKPGLLRAMVQDKCSSIGGGIDQAFCAKQPVRTTLREIAEHLFGEILEPRAIALIRVVIAQCAVQPDLGRLLYEAGPAVGKAKVAQYLEAQSDSGRIRVSRPEATAQMFFQMVVGHYHHQLLVGAIEQPSASEKAEHLDFALDCFMRVVAPN
jgi:AcrR family transcriptional regulator